MTGAFSLPPTSAMDGWLGIEEAVPFRPDEFAAAPTRRLFAWWRERAKGGPPHWGDLDTAILEAIEPYASLVRVAPDGTFDVALLGEEQERLVASARAGHHIAADGPIENQRRLFDHYRWIARHRMPLRCRGPLTFAGRPDRTFEALDVPLADDDGRITRIVGALVALP